MSETGLKPAPRTWISDDLDKMEAMLEARLKLNHKHVPGSSEHRNWVLMQHELLDSLKKMSEFETFMGHRYVGEQVRLKNEAILAKQATPSKPEALEPDSNVTKIGKTTKSSTPAQPIKAT